MGRSTAVLAELEELGSLLGGARIKEEHWCELKEDKERLLDLLPLPLRSRLDAARVCPGVTRALDFCPLRCRSIWMHPLPAQTPGIQDTARQVLREKHRLKYQPIPLPHSTKD